MLLELYIKNYIIIKEASLNFEKGLITITGESGSGKSLLLSSLELLFDSKLKTQVIMNGEEEALVIARFSPSREAIDFLEKNGFSSQESLLIKRSITYKKSNYYINNEPTTPNFLKQLSFYLLEFHMQNNQYTLLKDPKNNLKILDSSFDIRQLRREYKIAYDDYIKCKKDYNSWLLKFNEREAKVDSYKKSLEEIEKVSPILEEDVKIKEQLSHLSDFKEIEEAIKDIKTAFYGRESGALFLLKKSLERAEYLKSVNSKYGDLEERLNNCFYELEDIAMTYSNYYNELNYDPLMQDSLEERAFELSRLKKKYGATIEAILDLKEEYKTYLEGFQNFEEEGPLKKRELEEREASAIILAKKLSQARRERAKYFSTNVEKILRELDMKNARFCITFENSPLSENGIDKIDLLFSSNLGIKLEPIYKVASGGELSRLMLAIKTTEDVGENMLIIFDEIDAGIGGEAGLKLGEYLKKLSLNIQIFTITHLANIAALSDFHILMKKEDLDGKTIAKSILLRERAEREREIARMLSGLMSSISLEHARELLNTR